MDITLQFSTENGFGSKFIRWFTWSDFSHVDVVLPDGKLLGARIKGGVAIREPNYQKFTKTERYVVKDCPQAVMDFLMAQVGKPYDMRGIINMGLHERNWSDDDSWFCSELVAAAFEKGGKPLLRVASSERVTPRDLTLSVVMEPEQKFVSKYAVV